MKQRLEYALFRMIRWVVLALPLRPAQNLGAAFGTLSFRLMGKRRAITMENLSNAFPEKSAEERAAIALGAFQNYGISLIELLWFPNMTDEILRKLIHVRNIDLIRERHLLGKGIILLSGHFGNWELIAFGVAHLVNLPFSIIVQTQSNKYVDEAINNNRCLLGNKVIPMGMSVREIVTTLLRGGVVAIAPDQSGPMEGVFVDFFGRNVATHQGPAALALRAGAPMLMGFMVRQKDGTYEVTLEEVTTTDLSGFSDENMIELTRRHTAMLEGYIRRYPSLWLWMHRRWKHTWESVQKEKEKLNSANV
jgi:KDO2-lipid IV(A) lauroyltransferase